MAIRNFLRQGVSLLAYGGCAIAALSGIMALQWQRLVQPPQASLSFSQQEQQEILQMGSLNALPSRGFGFNNLLADWAFLQFLQYSGDVPARAETGYGAASVFSDLITKRDPRFWDAYIFISGTMSYDLGQPEKSIALLQRGIDMADPSWHPGVHQLWVLQGLDYLLLLGDPIKASAAYEKAAEWAALSPDPEIRETAPIFRRINQFLATDPDSTPVRYWAWSTVLEQAIASNSSKTLERAKQELTAMGAIESRDDKTGRLFFKPPVPTPTPKPTASPSPTTSPTANPKASPTASPTLTPRPLPSPKPEKPDEATPSPTPPSP
jgi:hypothetical protein